MYFLIFSQSDFLKCIPKVKDEISKKSIERNISKNSEMQDKYDF